MTIEKKKRGRPKNVKAVVKEEIKTPIELPIQYLGFVYLAPEDTRYAETIVGHFTYNTKTEEYIIKTDTFPPSWKQFEGLLGIGYYPIIDSKTGAELRIDKLEDSEKWIQYLEEAKFLTIRGKYRIGGITKVYEAQ